MMSFWLRSARVATTLVISASVRSPNIRTLALSAGWNGTSTLTVIINSGVDVASLNIAVANIPHDTLTIINNGRIGGVVNSGDAITTTSRIKIINNGTIFGGGGQGGTGQTVDVWYNVNDSATSGWGGNGGQGAGFSASGTVTMLAATSGQAGSTATYSGPVFAPDTPPTAYGGSGGAGGPIGGAGVQGAYGSYSGTVRKTSSSGPAAGMAAGRYIVGNSLVTWLSNGTRLGNVA